MTRLAATLALLAVTSWGCGAKPEPAIAPFKSLRIRFLPSNDSLLRVRLVVLDSVTWANDAVTQPDTVIVWVRP